MQSDDEQSESSHSRANTISNAEVYQEPVQNFHREEFQFPSQVPPAVDQIMKVRSADLNKHIKGKRDIW